MRTAHAKVRRFGTSVGAIIHSEIHSFWAQSRSEFYGAVLPPDVHITAKEEKHAVGLREADQVTRLGVLEAKFPRSSQRHAHRTLEDGARLRRSG